MSKAGNIDKFIWQGIDSSLVLCYNLVILV